MSGYSELATDSFELKRVMRQEAHEKAFEIKVINQRLFEKEKDKIVTEGKKGVDKKIDNMKRKLHTELNIKRSTQINKSRMKKMNYRNELMTNLVGDATKEIISKLADPENSEYRSVVKSLIIQSMLKLLEKKIKIRCRERDLDMVTGMVEEIEQEYSELMRKETDNDDYACTIEVVEDNYIKEDSDLGKCGGVILTSQDERIVCSNMLLTRLILSYEEHLPQLRHMLFPRV
uniref:V-type proton ATPase subunit E n=1 Tax=Euplotes harpa TaxID=151035 RepID=A0A7S3J6V4_9SPIT